MECSYYEKDVLKSKPRFEQVTWDSSGFTTKHMHYDPTEALERIDNDTDLLAMLIKVFIKECPNYTGNLQAACDRQDLNALGDAAHNVKGASAAIGFEACRALAEELEVTCRQSGVKSISHFENSTARLIEILNTCETPLSDWAKKNRA
ncbi:Hpt domain-containing protein [Limnobacter alexandrii]|uniref:Hpt domain-containing protein n=1 Tax=Limnobacter alexandrii TaxID=2570352 RepID=UPI00110810DA|nr:Hpt domain-containing protein [Limnobacter alexandrii]